MRPQVRETELVKPISFVYKGQHIACCYIQLDKDKEYGYLYGVQVHKDHRRKGLGTLLLTYAISTARAMHLKGLGLTVSPWDDQPMNTVELYDWYYTLGFRSVGGDQSAWLMTIDLRPSGEQRLPLT